MELSNEEGEIDLNEGNGVESVRSDDGIIDSDKESSKSSTPIRYIFFL